MPLTWSHSLVRTKKKQVSGAQRRLSGAERKADEGRGVRGQEERSSRTLTGTVSEERRFGAL